MATGRLSLLAHVTYYDSNKTQATAGASKSLKGSSGWREFCFGAVVQMLEEMGRRTHHFFVSTSWST